MRTLLLALLTLGASACRATPDDEAPAAPQRPSFSSDTVTTAQGTLELEAGLTWDPGDSLDTPLLLKYGSGPDTEVFLGTSPLIYLSRGEDEVGIGDLVLGLKHRLRREDELPSFALQPSIKLPTANGNEGLGTGEVDLSLAGILTRNLEELSLTGFYQLDLLGNPGGGQAVGHDLALAGSYALPHGVGIFAELTGRWVPAHDREEVFLMLGGSRALRPSLVFDLALLSGLSDDAPDAQLLFGFTRNLGRPGLPTSPRADG